MGVMISTFMHHVRSIQIAVKFISNSFSQTMVTVLVRLTKSLRHVRSLSQNYNQALTPPIIKTNNLLQYQ